MSESVLGRLVLGRSGLAQAESGGEETQTGSFTADAVLLSSPAGLLAIDAVKTRSMGASLTVDATISAGASTVSDDLTLDACIQYGFVDDIADTLFIDVPLAGDIIGVVTDFSSFTADAGDPDVVRDWSSNGNGAYSGWLGLDVASSVSLRIYTVAPGMQDTLLAIWGPSPTPPGTSDDPFHFGDDNFPSGARSSLHQVGSDPAGTLYTTGDAYSEDDAESGIPLTAGLWWICVWPYDDDDWDPSEGPVRLMLEGVGVSGSFTADAIRKATQTSPQGDRADYAFPANITGWNAANWAGYVLPASAISWASSDGHLANGSLEVGFASPGSDRAVIGYIGPLRAGNAYRLTFWIRSVTGTGNLQWGFGSLTDTGQRSAPVFNVPITTSWEQKSVDFTPTANVDDPVVWIASYGAIDKTIRIDEVRVESLSFLSLDAYIPGPVSRWLLVDAIIAMPGAGSVSLDAYVRGIGGDFFLDAVIDDFVYIETLFTLDAYIERSFTTLDAVILGSTRRGWFHLDAKVVGTFTRSFTLNANKVHRGFPLDAILGTVAHPTGSFIAEAWKVATSGSGSFTVAAYVDSYVGEQFSLDATIVGTERTGSTTLDADIAADGEERGSTSLDATLLRRTSSFLKVYAEIAQARPFTLDAWISATFTLDAAIAYLAGAGSFTLHAAKKKTASSSTTVAAAIADTNGSTRQINVNAVVKAGRSGFVYVVAIIRAPATFTLDAVLRRGITLDAFILPSLRLDAYIASASVVVYPPSHEGEDGFTSGTTFTDPTADFTPDLVGSTITIDGDEYVIASVSDGTTLVLTTPAPTGSDLPWSIPSGSATDAVGGVPPITRRFRTAILWSRPGRDQWHDMTLDVMWEQTSFTQSARVGAGPFIVYLKGSFPDLIGGEEVVAEIDDFRVFGGFVQEVEHAYVFEDDLTEPVTILHGVDYNIILDRLLVYNAAWDERKGGHGKYRNWTPFAKGTMDREIITTVASRYLIGDTGGFDFSTYVDEIDTPAQESKWGMEPGAAFRTILNEISRITEGVFWVDAYKNLQYHDRSTVTAPFPVTDGDGGISTRGLRVKRSLSIVTNDVFVWGIQASVEDATSKVIFDRQTADADWDETYWAGRVERMDERIEHITDIPPAQRTVKQKADLAALKRSRRIYQQNLDAALATDYPGSVERLGRWQYGEFRQDLLHRWSVEKRALSIMQRYSEPVVTGQATVFEPGFQAGQVVSLVSMAHGVAEDLVVREMRLDFAVAKEPDGTVAYSVPKYALAIGLDPEEPWDTYQYLPFPAFDIHIQHYNEPRGDPFPGLPDGSGSEDGGPMWLDVFSRTRSDDEHLGRSDSERIEIRQWRSTAIEG